MSFDIKKAVIHILDRDSDEPLLNEFELEVTEDINTFLEKHITKAFNDDDARKANFKEGINIVKDVCYRINADASYFLEGSKDIARQLFKAMKTNSSISSTDLIVCLYEDDEQNYVAILKMDYTVSFIHEIEVVDQKFKISIKKQDISLPGMSQKIQKCAFVKCNSHDESFDLVVLDNQITKKDAEEPVAQFFLQTFLSAELILDSKACTKLFKLEAENWIRSKSKEGETSAEVVREHVNNIIRGEEKVDIQSFSEKVFGGKVELRDDFIGNMKEKGLSKESFEVDKEWVEKKLSKIRLKTDNNIELVLDYEDFNNRDKIEVINNPDGTRSILIKNIISIIEK